MLEKVHHLLPIIPKDACAVIFPLDKTYLFLKKNSKSKLPKSEKVDLAISAAVFIIEYRSVAIISCSLHFYFELIRFTWHDEYEDSWR